MVTLYIIRLIFNHEIVFLKIDFRVTLLGSREDKLVEDIEPFLWYIRCQLEKINTCYMLIISVKETHTSADEMLKRYLQIIRDDDNKIGECKSKWFSVQGKLFSYLYNSKTKTAIGYDIMHELVNKIDKFHTVQHRSDTRLREHLEKDINCTRFLNMHSKISELINQLPSDKLYAPYFSEL